MDFPEALSTRPQEPIPLTVIPNGAMADRDITWALPLSDYFVYTTLQAAACVVVD
jgi:hypothetical protein